MKSALNHDYHTFRHLSYYGFVEVCTFVEVCEANRLDMYSVVMDDPVHLHW